MFVLGADKLAKMQTKFHVKDNYVCMVLHYVLCGKFQRHGHWMGFQNMATD